MKTNIEQRIGMSLTSLWLLTLIINIIQFCQNSPFIRRSPSWGIPGFSSVIRQMSDLCTAPGNISLSPLSLATDVTDMTLRASGLWLGTQTGAGGTATLALKLSWPQPMAPWKTGMLKNNRKKYFLFSAIPGESAIPSSKFSITVLVNTDICTNFC